MRQAFDTPREGVSRVRQVAMRHRETLLYLVHLSHLRRILVRQGRETARKPPILRGGFKGYCLAVSGGIYPFFETPRPDCPYLYRDALN